MSQLQSFYVGPYLQWLSRTEKGDAEIFDIFEAMVDKLASENALQGARVRSPEGKTLYEYIVTVAYHAESHFSRTIYYIEPISCVVDLTSIDQSAEKKQTCCFCIC